MATLQWDHAVQFVNQPEAAIEIFAGQQLRAVAGGRHPGWGTRNALSYFGPVSYTHLTLPTTS
ncbi:VOC family protein, partial [Klebsiella pneumoniae]|uniref:VOC family protein n=1 Tax=Klebsiella pneumoniae TaxID=573 RepID=UPI0039EF15A3